MIVHNPNALSPLASNVLMVAFLVVVFSGPTITAAKIWGADAIGPVVFTLLWICLSVVALLVLYPSSNPAAGYVKIAVLIMGLPLSLFLIFAGRMIAKRVVRGRSTTARGKVTYTDWPD